MCKISLTLPHLESEPQCRNFPHRHHQNKRLKSAIIDNRNFKHKARQASCIDFSFFVVVIFFFFFFCFFFPFATCENVVLYTPLSDTYKRVSNLSGYMYVHICTITFTSFVNLSWAIKLTKPDYNIHRSAKVNPRTTDDGVFFSSIILFTFLPPHTLSWLSGLMKCLSQMIYKQRPYCTCEGI